MSCRLVTMLTALALALPAGAAGAPLYRRHLTSLAPAKGHYLLELGQTVEYGFFYFDEHREGNRSRSAATPGGAEQRYFASRTELAGRYALTESVELSLLVPLAYRQESRFWHADRAGLGDVELQSQVVFYRHGARQHPLSLLLEVKFPTGASTLDPAPSGRYGAIPLGSGQSDLCAGLRHRYQALSFSLSQSLAYRWRRAARVAYLQGGAVAGNLNLNYGDELHYQILAQFEVNPRLRPYVGVAAVNRWGGHRERVADDGSGQLTLLNEDLPSGYLLEAALGLEWRVQARTRLFLEGKAPFFGRNTPLLPVAEGLLGPAFFLGVSFEG